jgi:hypothetical protein
MQNDSIASRFKNSFLYLGWVFFFLCLWLKGCSSAPGETVVKDVVIPEKTGIFESKKPKHNHIVEVNKMVIPDNLTNNNFTDFVKLQNDIAKLYEENALLLNDFEKETDSLKRIIMYQNAIALNKFSTTFEDDNLLLNIDGIVRGEVQSITPSYKIKEQKIEVPIKQKEVKFRMLIGAGIGNSLQFDRALFKANVGFQNAKGNILQASFDTEQRVMLEYNLSLFKVKR